MLPDGTRPATIHIQDGRIARIGGYDDGAADSAGIDAESLVVLPGLVDTHVHINEPGRTEWEGFASATRAAAAGGVTTLVDMPLNSRPSTVSAEAFEAKRQRRRRTTPRRRRLLGRRRPRQRDGHSAAGGSGRPRVQEFSCAFGRRGIPARSRRRLAGGASAPPDDWSPSACPRRTTVAPARSDTRREPAKLSNLARNATGGERGGGDRPDDPARARVGRTNSCRAPLDGRSTGGHSARPRERRRDLLRDVSALPDLRRRTNC